MFEALGLADYFDDVISGAECARAKPFPDPYEGALSSLGLRAEEALVLEDSPAGIRAAKGAGLAVVGLLTGQEAADLLAAGADVVRRVIRGWRGSWARGARAGDRRRRVGAPARTDAPQVAYVRILWFWAPRRAVCVDFYSVSPHTGGRRRSVVSVVSVVLCVYSGAAHSSPPSSPESSSTSAKATMSTVMSSTTPHSSTSHLCLASAASFSHASAGV